MTDQPSHRRPLLSCRDHPALLDVQRLLYDVDRAAAIALERLEGTLDGRVALASAPEREPLTALVRRMEAAQAAAAEGGVDLYR
jgi:hypothetical protein